MKTLDLIILALILTIAFLSTLMGCAPYVPKKQEVVEYQPTKHELCEIEYTKTINVILKQQNSNDALGVKLKGAKDTYLICIKAAMAK